MSDDAIWGVSPDKDDAPKHILCIGGEPAIRRRVTAFLREEGFQALCAEDGAAALTLLAKEHFDAVLLDLTLPGLSGLTTLAAIAAARPCVPVIALEGTGGVAGIIEAVRGGAWDILTKPLDDMALLLRSLHRTMERARRIRENQLQRERPETRIKSRTEKLLLQISERVEAENALQVSLTEKEALLLEIHHRVKNNLQIISSLLSLQAIMLDDDQRAAPFLDSQARIQAMAMVHEKLYASRDLNKIDFPSYLRELSLFLIQAYSRPALVITPVIECGVESLPVDTAIPCGLILSELISNCLKHAFSSRQAGIIAVRAIRLPDGQVSLTVTDNGAGLPQGFDIAKAWTLGVRLVTNLVRQMHGTLHVESGREGTTFHLTFPVRPHASVPGESAPR